jgi:hypothetical protein
MNIFLLDINHDRIFHGLRNELENQKSSEEKRNCDGNEPEDSRKDLELILKIFE